MRAAPRIVSSAALAVSLLVVVPAIAVAAAVVGFKEGFPTANGTAGWGGGALLENPGFGGAPGSDDGWLKVTRDVVQQLGANSTGAEYTGNWTTAGITQVRLWLTDPAEDEATEIHFGLGVAFSNFWQYDVGFVPPLHKWAPFVVDLNSAAWTRTVGTSGTFAAAKSNVERILLRHDKAPFVQTPDPILGDFGIDRILLTNGVVGVEDAIAVSSPVELAPPSPNPSAGPVALSYRLGEAGKVRLEVVDVSGRRVRSIERMAAAGPNTWLWDGRDDRGARVPPGAYRVRAIGEAGGTSRPLVRIAR